MIETLEQLTGLRSKPLKGAENALSVGEIDRLIGLLPGWILSADRKHISKEFKFRDFHRTMAFVNALAFIAHQEDHHPDLEAGYNYCVVRYSTHDVGGLSRNDFISAAKVSALGLPA